jgi:hypothetical protein
MELISLLYGYLRYRISNFNQALFTGAVQIFDIYMTRKSQLLQRIT